MNVKIVAAKTKLKQLQLTVNKARTRGDLQTARKAQGILGVLQGTTYEEIAGILCVTCETIRLWLRDFMAKGSACFKIKFGSGRPPRLTKSQQKQLKKTIKDGPEASGYLGGCWRSPMVQDFIYMTFGVFYAVAYIAQLLKNLGLSYQKACFASAHKDPEERKKWLAKRWPEALKLSEEMGGYLFFGDEVSFPQWGSLSYTWAPKGKQPTVKTSGSRKGYKVFGVIDYWTGKFFSKGISGKFNAESYADFLREVMAKTRGFIVLIQDGARYHTCEAMQVFFYENRFRLKVVQMPAYSPDYNPIEILWKKVKDKGVHLKFFPTFESLVERVEQLLASFAEQRNEVLKVFGFYTKPAKA